jgi:hypothetical protein
LIDRSVDAVEEGFLKGVGWIRIGALVGRKADGKAHVIEAGALGQPK